MTEQEKRDLSLMSWTEAAQALAAHSVVLIPIGTSEAQGTHAPTGADYLLAHSFARHVAHAAPDTIYLTGIPYGNSSAFRGFCGTVWLQPETLQAVVYDVCYSLLYHGFDHLVVVNNHGPNEPSIEAALRRLRDEHGILVPCLWPSALAKRWMHELFEPVVIGHGAEPTTSLMAHLVPGSVNLNLVQESGYQVWQGLEPESSTRARFDGHTIGLYLDVDEYAPLGLRTTPQGDPELGRRLMEKLVEFGVRFVEHFRTMDVRMKKRRGL